MCKCVLLRLLEDKQFCPHHKCVLAGSLPPTEVSSLATSVVDYTALGCAIHRADIIDLLSFWQFQENVLRKECHFLHHTKALCGPAMVLPHRPQAPKSQKQFSFKDNLGLSVRRNS